MTPRDFTVGATRPDRSLGWLLIVAVLAVQVLVAVRVAEAAGEAPEIPRLRWQHEGLFGTIDQTAAQRGLHVYRQVCASCHGLRLVRFRHLAGIGFSTDQVRAIAAEFEVRDGPDAQGEMFTRQAVVTDAFPEPYPSEQVAAELNAGAIPPDLSLITRARAGGADYIAALLTGYVDPPPDEGVELSAGQYYNRYISGHVIAMAPPLYDEGVEYVDGTTATVEQQARDVAVFLTFTADPHHDQRAELGVRVLLFLIVFTALLYAYKRRLWGRLKRQSAAGD